MQQNARKRTGAQGGAVHALGRIRKSLVVTLQHHGVGQKVVRKRDGLGALQVRVSRHDDVGILLGLLAKHADHLLRSRV